MGSPFETGRFAQVADLGQVASLEDVRRVLHQMIADLEAHPDAWENHTLDRYLDALAYILDTLPDQLTTDPPREPTWKYLAYVLVKATGYE